MEEPPLPNIHKVNKPQGVDVTQDLDDITNCALVLYLPLIYPDARPSTPYRISNSNSAKHEIHI